MLPYILGAAVVTHAVPDIWSWGFWGAKVVVKGTYWLVYGRFEEMRKEQRLRKAIQEDIKKELMEYELVLGGTDLILVPKKINSD